MANNDEYTKWTWDESQSPFLSTGADHEVYLDQELTVRYIAEKLKEVKEQKSYGHALICAYSLNYEKVCLLADKYTTNSYDIDNNPNIMPSEFMILRGASDKELEANGCLSSHPLKPDHKISVENLFYYYKMVTKRFSLYELNRGKYDHGPEDKFEGKFFDTVSKFINGQAPTEESLVKSSMGGNPPFYPFEKWFHSEVDVPVHTAKFNHSLNHIAYSKGIPNIQVLLDLNPSIDVDTPIENGTEIKIPNINDNPFIDFPGDYLNFGGFSFIYYYPYDYFAIKLYEKKDPFEDFAEEVEFSVYDHYNKSRSYFKKKIKKHDEIKEVLPVFNTTLTWGVKGHTFHYDNRLCIHPDDLITEHQDSVTVYSDDPY